MPPNTQGPASAPHHAILAGLMGQREMPCVLLVGGLDPGGGAGVLADARAVARAGAFGCAAVAVLTVQSTSGMRSATPVASRELIAECTEVVKHQRVRAIKVGALGSEENVKAVGDFLAAHRNVPSVVDTPMRPTRGRARLLQERALRALRLRVVPRATLLTVNAPEAEAITGRRVTRLDEARDAAKAILDLGAHAVLVKGGHLDSGRGPRAVDVLATSDRVITLAAARLRVEPFHGGGCALASLIAGRLAAAEDPFDLEPAVRWAKRIHHAALARTTDVGGDLRVLFAS
jgi:hydroxymethylpyrimidine/phosphomethylpyrimidine kinase